MEDRQLNEIMFDVFSTKHLRPLLNVERQNLTAKRFIFVCVEY